MAREEALTPEQPLHVRVAIALGLKPRQVRVKGSTEYFTVWSNNPYYSDGSCGEAELRAIGVPRYDIEWMATGPLIEKYDILIAQTGADWIAANGKARIDSVDWMPREVVLPIASDEQAYAYGDTPLEAVCHLLLALKAAGKLEAK